MRYVAPTRESLDRSVLASPPLSAWRAYGALLASHDWPDTAALNARLPDDASVRFVMQDKALLDDGLHYEERIALHGGIATRPANWHDLLNAMIWLRYPSLKRVLNARQMQEIARMGRRERSRPQCALTHFDEAGIVVSLRDPAMLRAWDAHDWPTLFWTHRQAWLTGEARVEVFGHALLEHALTPGKLLVGKALVVMADKASIATGGGRAGDDADAGWTTPDAVAVCADAIGRGVVLNDPQELRPLPVSGVPGWHADTGDAAFYSSAPCFQPLREGRTYPPPLRQTVVADVVA